LAEEASQFLDKAASSWLQVVSYRPELAGLVMHIHRDTASMVGGAHVARHFATCCIRCIADRTATLVWTERAKGNERMSDNDELPRRDRRPVGRVFETITQGLLWGSATALGSAVVSAVMWWAGNR
jgi:hypothetical protein